MVRVAAAARAATVRTWFQNVQLVMYAVHRRAPSALAGSTAANALLSGTLKTIVTSIVPTR